MIGFSSVKRIPLREGLYSKVTIELQLNNLNSILLRSAITPVFPRCACLETRFSRELSHGIPWSLRVG